MYAAAAMALPDVSQASSLAVLILSMVIADAAITLTFIVLATVSQHITDQRYLGRVAGASGTVNALIVTVAAAGAGFGMGYIGIQKTTALWPLLMLPALVGAVSLSIGSQKHADLPTQTVNGPDRGETNPSPGLRPSPPKPPGDSS